ncbi:MAG: hypothetical protein KA170_00600 [Candidatus Promineofilum sp.]|nr:hypothetical protein [Promineifilum sp.]
MLVTTALLLVLLASTLAFAQGGSGQFTATPLFPSGEPIDTAKPESDGPNAASAAVDPTNFRVISVIVTLDQSISADAVAGAVDAQVVNRYDRVFKGASLLIAGENVAELATLKGVTGVYLDTLQQLDTEVSPQFIGAPTAWNALGGQGSAGEGVIVGILDSGI